MNDKNINEESFSDLRLGMEALKNNLTSGSLISDKEIRRAMRTESIWLNRLVLIEFITLPVVALGLFAWALYSGMSIWLMIVFVVFAIPDTFLDVRTLAISKKWIQNETLLSLSKKLIRQKIERQRQTIISTSLMVPWAIWFVYEYLKHNGSFIPDDVFIGVWAILSGFLILISVCVIVVVYKKAQRTNDIMIKSVNSFVEED